MPWALPLNQRRGSCLAPPWLSQADPPRLFSGPSTSPLSAPGCSLKARALGQVDKLGPWRDSLFLSLSSPPSLASLPHPAAPGPLSLLTSLLVLGGVYSNFPRRLGAVSLFSVPCPASLPPSLPPSPPALPSLHPLPRSPPSLPSLHLLPLPPAGLPPVPSAARGPARPVRPGLQDSTPSRASPSVPPFRCPSVL